MAWLKKIVRTVDRVDSARNSRSYFVCVELFSDEQKEFDDALNESHWMTK